MYKTIDIYCKYVIKPVEDYTKKLRILVANKSFFEKIFNIDYKDKALMEMEKVLEECYNKLSIIINEENNSNFIEDKPKI